MRVRGARGRVAAGLAAAAMAGAALAWSCALVLVPDLSGTVYFPERENQVITQDQVPSIRFAIVPERSSVEAIFTVADVGGRVSGRYSWDGQRVAFVPEPPLVHGRRYVMSFSGSFRDQRGVEYQVDRVVPFFVGSAAGEALYVVESDPVSGGMAARDQEIRVEFSRPVDPLSAPRGLSLSPDTRHSLRWENDNRILYLCPEPEEGWDHLCVYTLRLDEELLDPAGTPLARAEEIVFLVQEDSAAPTVQEILPAFDDPSAGFPLTGLSLEEEVGLQEAIRIRFSEAMEPGATEESFSLCPPAAGVLYWPDVQTLVFVPEAGYQAGTAYLILLSERACDACGNRLDGYVPVGFTTRAAGIEITTTFLDDGTVILPGGYTTVAPLPVRLGPGGECNLLLTLSGGSFETSAEKQAVLEAITLSGVFPPSGVPVPELIGFSWDGDVRLSLTYAGLELSTPSHAVYYLLRIRGGVGGVATDGGEQLERDLEQLLRWEEAPP
ncbi:MAG: Ig-like domain-containing protein [Spirochaetales bacterium]|nr:Ig-like domain-containing protein [Spirochaetales bacterium]